MTFEEEQKKLFLNYLDVHVFQNWKGLNTKNLTSLELIVSPICNTKCSYCYYKNFDKYLYPKEIRNQEKIIENCENLLKWIQKENFQIPDIDIFSGEFFNLPYYKKILELLSFYLPKNRRTKVMIPTNATFCFSDEKAQEIQDLLTHYNSDSESNLRISLSLSCDGKYLDNETRPLRNGKQYTDDYYDRLFKFAAKNRCGFHPMIDSKGIENWKKNIDWYVENIVKYSKVSELEAIGNIYLLEVRNPDWTLEKINAFKDFISYYGNKVFTLCNRDPEKFYEYMRESSSNIFRSVTAITDRGMHCSIQNTLAVRLGDLAVVPCHRTAYSGFNAGFLTFDENSNMDITLENPLYWMSINSFDSINGPKCSTCVIRKVCGLYCGGCNYEVNGDFFTPVDTVCDMEIAKTTALIQVLLDTNTFDLVCNNIGDYWKCKELATDLKKIRKVLLEKEQKR